MNERARRRLATFLILLPLLLLAAPGAAPANGLPIDLYTAADLGWWILMGAIVIAALISEDLTCLTVGLLISEGKIHWLPGLASCFLGNFLGDVALWAVGWGIRRQVLDWHWVRKIFPESRRESCRLWLRRYGWGAVGISRFVPGTRLPTYLGAGLLGYDLWRFSFWTAIAGVVWTPLIVFGAAWFGGSIKELLTRMVGRPVLALVLAVVLLAFLWRHMPLLLTANGRRALVARYARYGNHEFWPAWLFYAPLVPYLAYLGLRYGGCRSFTAVNPGMPAGGIVGESKIDILDRLPTEWIVPSALVTGGDSETALAAFDALLAERGWSYPLIFKPNASQRGVGLKLVRNREAAAHYFSELANNVLVQTWHPGPCEAGIFYYRFPDEPRGHIYSITDKQFPVIVGDGRHSLEDLIWRHPRYRIQARVFRTRHAAQLDRVLAAGEQMPLGVAGNHCQGALFFDGAELITPALEARVDAIAQAFEGFYFGRFDVRYRDVNAFKAGEDLAIVELNGALSESTNIYDPAMSIWRAWAVLFRQWRLALRIGRANRRAGAPTAGFWQVVNLIRHHYTARELSTVSD